MRTLLILLVGAGSLYGCARPAAAASHDKCSLEDDALDGMKLYEFEGLTIAEFIVGDAEPEDALPVVVRIHGRASRPSTPSTRSSVPHRLLLPLGPLRAGCGRSWFDDRYGDYDEREELQDAIGERSAQLARALRLVAEEIPHDSRWIIAGFSQGAVLAYGVARELPEFAAEVVVAGGWFPLTLDPPMGGTMIVNAVHGETDEVVPLVAAENTVRAWQRQGIPVVLEVVGDEGHDMGHFIGDRFEEHLAEALHRRSTPIAL